MRVNNRVEKLVNDDEHGKRKDQSDDEKNGGTDRHGKRSRYASEVPAISEKEGTAQTDGERQKLYEQRPWLTNGTP